MYKLIYKICKTLIYKECKRNLKYKHVSKHQEFQYTLRVDNEIYCSIQGNP